MANTLLAGGLSAWGADAQNRQNQARQNDALTFNKEEAQKNRDWQEYMANSAHVREVKDLKDAGLNPILSVNKGADTGGGAQASSPGIARAENLAAGLSASAIDTAKLMIDAKNVDNQGLQIQSNISKNNADIANTNADTEKKASDTNLVKQMITKTAADTESQKYSNAIQKAKQSTQLQMAPADAALDTGMKAAKVLESGTGAVSNVLRLLPGMGGASNAKDVKEKWTSQKERDEIERQTHIDRAESLFPKR